MACFRLFTDTAANWTADNPRHERGAVGVEVDEEGVYGKAKIFDGVNRWNSLAYWIFPVTAGENIADPTGAATDQDDEARTAIVSILDLLETAGLMEAAE